MTVDVHLSPGRQAVSGPAAPAAPTSYVTRFEWTGPGLPATSGELILGYAPTGDGVVGTHAPTGDGEVGTHAALVPESAFGTSSAMDERALAALATGFQLNLARAAELRNRAA